jgi:hypothetical protein
LAPSNIPAARPPTSSPWDDIDGDDAEVVRERPPHHPTERDAEWGAEGDVNEGDGARLPAHCPDDLASHEAEDLQQGDVSPPAHHAGDDQVQQRGRPEHGKSNSEEEGKLTASPKFTRLVGGVEGAT